MAGALAPGPAQAGQARRSPTPPATTEAPAGAWASAPSHPARDCGRARRKLWLPGEGWVVRTVTACR